MHFCQTTRPITKFGTLTFSFVCSKRKIIHHFAPTSNRYNGSNSVNSRIPRSGDFHLNTVYTKRSPPVLQY